jgi:hypothetical protein
MRFKVKLLHWPDAGHHAVVITRGVVDARDVVNILRAITHATESLLDCKVLIDFEDAECRISASDRASVIDSVGPQPGIQRKKIALVSGARQEQHAALIMLSAWLSACGLTVAVFHALGDATAWLAEPL